jgi:hypothetical protein
MRIRRVTALLSAGFKIKNNLSPEQRATRNARQRELRLARQTPQQRALRELRARQAQERVRQLEERRLLMRIRQMPALHCNMDYLFAVADSHDPSLFFFGYLSAALRAMVWRTHLHELPTVCRDALKAVVDVMDAHVTTTGPTR